jgi:hypothetical protein
MALSQLHYLFILELHNDTFLLCRLCNDRMITQNTQLDATVNHKILLLCHTDTAQKM